MLDSDAADAGLLPLFTGGDIIPLIPLSPLAGVSRNGNRVVTLSLQHGPAENGEFFFFFIFLRPMLLRYRRGYITVGVNIRDTFYL